MNRRQITSDGPPVAMLPDDGLPSVTINIAVFNEAARMQALLESIALQTYPADRVETLIVDGGSTDRTVEICRSFGCRVESNPARQSDIGRRLGCELATGDLHIYLDADMEWSNPSCLARLVQPFLEMPSLVGSFPRFLVDSKDPPLNRCLSYHPLQQDPLMRFLSTQIEETVFKPGESYSLCRFAPGRAPVLGVVLFRTSLLKEFLNEWGPSWRWSDVDFVVECAERGLAPFAYVPSAGIYHRSFLKPAIYLKKKQRDVRGSYLDTVGKRKASYLSWSNKRDLLRLLLWISYVNALIPPALTAAARSLKHRDPALLYEAFLSIVGTDYVLWNFVLDRRGRALAKTAAASLLPSAMGLVRYRDPQR
ncbi:MAG: hypothetical protein QOH48_2100 [Actinomycetota bacterium]|jgi:glycosyltransferase involved in cell wall biosynthesis|nr:hypothetical protein [Actinomycetota bacterium]